ncbi:MAG: hypothetical protein R3C97_15440 [Geminicoccaceae bacterium]
MRRATLNAEQRAREQEAMVARRTQELRELMARSSQIAMKLDSMTTEIESRRKKSSAGTESPVRALVDREAQPGTHAIRNERKKGSSGRDARAGTRAQVQPAGRLSDVLTRQQMLAALERVR